MEERITETPNSPGNGVKEHLDSLHNPNPKGMGVPMATWAQPSADSNIPLTQNSYFSWIHQLQLGGGGAAVECVCVLTHSCCLLPLRNQTSTWEMTPAGTTELSEHWGY